MVRSKISFLFLISLILLPFVFANNVAYIAKSENRVLQEFVDSIESKGFEIEFILDKNIDENTDFSQYEFVFISDDLLPNTAEYFDLTKYKTITINRRYGYEFGLTDEDDISHIGSTSPLQVKYDGEVLTVYDRSNVNGISVPYYYLNDLDRIEGFRSVARTYIGKSGQELGDVVSVAPENVALRDGRVTSQKVCFYGIAKSTYWTENARDIFEEECLNFVLEGVICEEDLDCGIDGFVGAEYCSLGGDVVREYQEYTCNNPGTSDSFCSSEIYEQIINDCSIGCEDGSCINQQIECYIDSDCDDNNVYTIDECIFPGTENSFCRNTLVNCVEDSDCGFTGFLGEEYCSLDDVAKNYQTAICNNPGTLESFCQVDVDPIIVNECQFACYEGSCIRCEEDLQCDDGDYLTIDTCVNPGTLESFCDYSYEDEAIELEIINPTESYPFFGNLKDKTHIEFSSENADLFQSEVSEKREINSLGSYYECIENEGRIIVENFRVLCLVELCSIRGNIDGYAKLDDYFNGENYEFLCDWSQEEETPGEYDIHVLVAKDKNNNGVISSDEFVSDLEYDSIILDENEFSSREDYKIRVGVFDQRIFDEEGRYEFIDSVVTIGQETRIIDSSLDPVAEFENISSNNEFYSLYNSPTYKSKEFDVYFDEKLPTCFESNQSTCYLESNDWNTFCLQEIVDNAGINGNETVIIYTCEARKENNSFNFHYGIDLPITGESVNYVVGLQKLVGECHVGEYANKVAETTLYSYNEEFVVAIDQELFTNGINAPEGYYFAEVSDGAWSRWENDTFDTSIHGGGQGLVWESDFYIRNNNFFQRVADEETLKATKQEAENSGLGDASDLFYHEGGDIYIYLEDEPIWDNRDSLQVSLYVCEDNKI